MGRRTVLAALVCLALMLCACDNQEIRAPDDLITRFVHLWQQGDWAAMYQLLSAEARARWDAETFCRRYEKISRGIGLQQLAVTELEIAKDTARYTLEFRTSTAGDFSLEYEAGLVRTREGWKLHWDHRLIFPQLTEHRVVKVTRQMPRRGAILDCNNVPLAAAGPVFCVGLVPGAMQPDSAAKLSLLLDVPESEIRRLLEQSWVRPDTFVPVRTVGEAAWQQLREALTAVKGVKVREQEGRVYNIPDSLAQTVGYVGEIEAEQLQELADLGFAAGDIVGRAGLELVYDSVLAGRPGFTISVWEGDSEVAVVARRAPVPGRDVVTTLDLAQCRQLDAVLGGANGSMLLLEFATGAIRGVVSNPGFDCNWFALGITAGQYRELADRDAPFVNRAFNGLYPPGSVFKPFTALMALEEGVYDPEYSWDTPLRWQKSPQWGSYHVTRVVRPPHPVDLWEAMKWSDNVYFADLGLKLGWEALERYGAALGFARDIPLSLNYQRSQIRKQGGSEILLADTSYGQGEMLTTPLHVALMYAAIARQDGNLPLPRLTADDPAGIWLETGFSAENLQLLDSVLAYAASDEEARAWVGHGAVRGKTGTSEISATRQIAWYVCYFDQYVLVITLEGDRSLSSLHAAALARECLEGIKR